MQPEVPLALLALASALVVDRLADPDRMFLLESRARQQQLRGLLDGLRN